MSVFSFYFENAERPAAYNFRDCFILRRNDNWNDYSNIVRFDLLYVSEGGERTDIGKVKILQLKPYATKSFVEKTTDLPLEFNHLNKSEYISLGQQQHYYQRLAEILGIERALLFLEAMCDISFLPALAEPFETSSIFRNALLRENEATLARRYGVNWVKGEEIPSKPAFEYSVTIGNGDIPTEVHFDLNENDIVPGRIVCIVGRNAVGKTGFMAQLARDLAQLGYRSVQRQEKEKVKFRLGRPLFPRVIAISYSAFDKFKRPKADPSSTYVYCGIRNERGALSSNSLSQSFDKNKARISDLDLIENWIDHVRTILGEEGISEADLRREFEEDKEVLAESFFDRLSSGQAILCHFVTALLAWIQPSSLVLFDEPETHLHPNAVASLFLVFSRILKANQSFAVVATHSPIVLQEIPAKRVVRFVRRGATTTNVPLEMESFGESITELTRHVFNTIEVESPYKETLRHLAKKEGSPEGVLRHFPNGLGLAAEAYLLAQFEKNGEPR